MIERNALRAVVRSQYLAALDMLVQTVRRCPDALWYDPVPQNAFWHVAYHAAFYTHLYLQPAEADFAPWAKHRNGAHVLGSAPGPSHRAPVNTQPYSREEVLEYLAFLRAEVEARVSSLDLEAGSGFYWLPFDKLELQFYNIRHLQHHTGELGERLGAHGIEVDWVGRGG